MRNFCICTYWWEGLRSVPSTTLTAVAALTAGFVVIAVEWTHWGLLNIRRHVREAERLERCYQD
jgi:hypothetical protein